MTTVIDLRPACARFAELVAATTDDQLTAPTPCTAYDVGDLVDHVALVAEGAVALARKDLAAVASGRTASGRDHLGAGWRDDVATLLAALGEAWADPAAWEGAGGVPGSDLTHETWGRIALTEVVVHGWDLAVATGQPFALPAGTLEACWAHVAAFVPDAPVPAIWGPPVAVAADAPTLDRILGVTGRMPV